MFVKQFLDAVKKTKKRGNTGTCYKKDGVTFGSLILATPPCFRISAGTRSSAITAQA